MMRTPASGGCGTNDLPGSDGPSDRSRHATGTLVVVQVDIGPVSSASATAWIDYARAVLEGYGFDREQPVDDHLGIEIVTSFRRYLDQWARIAKRGGEFRWTAEIDLEEVEYMVHAFYRVATLATAAAEARGKRLMPPEGSAFYESLIHGLLDALESVGAPAADFAAELRQFWPRFK